MQSVAAGQWGRGFLHNLHTCRWTVVSKYIVSELQEETNASEVWSFIHQQSCTQMVSSAGANLEYTLQQDSAV